MKKRNKFFPLFPVDTNQKVHRYCNPDDLWAYFKMYFEKERFNPLMVNTGRSEMLLRVYTERKK